MSTDQFQQRYHNYSTPDRATALAEAARVNRDLWLSHAASPAVPVNFGRLGFGLMLRSAVESLGGRELDGVWELPDGPEMPR